MAETVLMLQAANRDATMSNIQVYKEVPCFWNGLF